MHLGNVRVDRGRRNEQLLWTVRRCSRGWCCRTIRWLPANTAVVVGAVVVVVADGGSRRCVGGSLARVRQIGLVGR